MPLNQSFLLAATNGYLATLPQPYSPVAAVNPTIAAAAAPVSLCSLLGIVLASNTQINHVQGTGLVRIGPLPISPPVWTDTWVVPPRSVGALIGQDGWVAGALNTAGTWAIASTSVAAQALMLYGTALQVTTTLGQTAQVARPITATVSPFQSTFLVYFPALKVATCNVRCAVSSGVAGNPETVQFVVELSTGAITLGVLGSANTVLPAIAAGVLHTLVFKTSNTQIVSYSVDGAAFVSTGFPTNVEPILSVAYRASDAISNGDVYVGTGRVESLDLGGQGFLIPDGTGVQFQTPLNLTQLFVVPNTGNVIPSSLNIIAVAI